VLEITEGGWRIDDEKVRSLTKRVQDEVDGSWIVILQLLDNSVYFVEGELGETYLPKKVDGKYHVDGALRLASTAQAGRTFKKVLPIIHALKQNRKIIMAPQTRYFDQPCCENPGHCTNIREADYKRRMLEGISSIRREIKDICYDERATLYHVVNPCGILGFYDSNREEEADGHKGNDPVHLAASGYEKLAQVLTQQVEDGCLAFSGGKRELEEEDPMSQEMRANLPKRRDWIYKAGGAGAWRGGSRGRRGGPGLYGGQFRGARGSGPARYNY
jgi:hypothetical protein